jgi:putative membrane protein
VYPWIKVLHLVAVISWMAGLLYFPRLLVYHSEAKANGTNCDTFIIMERRLLRAIMNPAMIVVWISGLGLAFLAGFFHEFWFLGKFGIVGVLTAFHMFLAGHRRRIEAGGHLYSSRSYRIINEIPTVLLVCIVVLVVIKPF